MSRYIVFILISLFASVSQAAIETWEMRMTLYVPRVYDNTKSKGYRKYQVQNLSGFFTVENYSDREPTVTFTCLENKTHKVRGCPVTYDVTVDNILWHGIGSNRTCKFDTRSCSLSLVCEPSYSIGEEPTEDNSLIIVLSGKGKTILNGFVAGQIGCGCAEYGHVSPTRIWNTSHVVDTASVYGKWKAKRIR